MTMPGAKGRVIVIGASAAGLTVAQELRRHGYTGEVQLIGDEEHLPYDRPPLSKQLLTGAWEADRLYLTSRDRLADLDVEVRLSKHAVALDIGSTGVGPVVRLDDGTELTSDSVVIATGCSPRQLPGTKPAITGLHTLRTLTDAQRLRDELGTGRRIVVIGGGFLGMEVAAVARTSGTQVTIISPGQPMVGAVGPAVGAALAELHTENGVRMLIGCPVEEITADTDRVTGVRLADGYRISCDTVVVAIGASPNTDWLTGSGLRIDDGVLCDATLLAAPGVYAAGDVARWRDPRSGQLIRVEHRMHAAESAAVVAANIMGQDLVYVPVPFWWSDQYSAKIQFYGWPSVAAHLWQGDLADRKAVVLYSNENGCLTGVLGWNSIKATRSARELLIAGACLGDVGRTKPLDAG